MNNVDVAGNKKQITTNTNCAKKIKTKSKRNHMFFFAKFGLLFLTTFFRISTQELGLASDLLLMD